MMPNNEQDIVRATVRGRFFSVGGFILAFALIALFQFGAMPIINASLVGNPTAATVKMLRWIFGGFAALAIIPSAAMIVVGRKIIRLRQYPLPDAWVWRDTPVKRGAAAKRIGKLCVTAGIIGGIVSIALLAYIWMVFDRVSLTPQLRPGVTILQAPIIQPSTPATVK